MSKDVFGGLVYREDGIYCLLKFKGDYSDGGIIGVAKRVVGDFYKPNV